MDENDAKSVADALGGDAWNSGGDIWLVVCERADGMVVAVSDDAVCEYESRDALENGRASSMIALH